MPPPSITAGIRLSAVMRAGWVLAALVLLQQGIVTAEYFAVRDIAEEGLLPITAVAAVGLMLGILAILPGWITALAYLLVGMVSIALYVLRLSELGIVPGDIVLVNTIGTALVLVGAVTGEALGGVAWTCAGLAVTQVTVMGMQAYMGVPPAPDIYAGMTSIVILGTYLLLWRNERIQARLADMAPVEAEVRREQDEQAAQRRHAAIVHETVLRDLALVAHGPPQLNDFDRARLRRHVEAIAERREPGGPDHDLPGGDFYDIVREFQWRGLSVDVGGTSYAVGLLAPSVREALLGAVRAALDNVLEHSGQTHAEIFIDQGVDGLTLMVIDEGLGFDQEVVAADRLGLRVAITHRIEDHGGSVSVWTAPSAGTSIVMTVPQPDAERVER